MSIRKIADQLGRAPSTISRELRRNASEDRGYRPFEAHRRATANRARHHRRRVDTNDELRQLVAELLAQRWSPEQISRQLRRRFPGQPGIWLCHESIYRAVYQPGSPLQRPSCSFTPFAYPAAAISSWWPVTQLRQPWGQMPLGEILERSAMEFLVHTWDLAQATSQAAVLDPALVRDALGPVGQFAPLARSSGLVGPECAVTDDADDLTRLLAIYGPRNPAS